VDGISPNTNLSYYQILSKLGAAGMAEVYPGQIRLNSPAPTNSTDYADYTYSIVAFRERIEITRLGQFMQIKK
jgi:hypothetical protein